VGHKMVSISFLRSLFFSSLEPVLKRHDASCEIIIPRSRAFTDQRRELFKTWPAFDQLEMGIDSYFLFFSQLIFFLDNI
jgi:hypothetical protein